MRNFSRRLLDKNIHYIMQNLDLFCRYLSVFSHTVFAVFFFLQKFSKLLMICSGSMDNLQKFSALTRLQAMIAFCGTNKPETESTSSWDTIFFHSLNWNPNLTITWPWQGMETVKAYWPLNPLHLMTVQNISVQHFHSVSYLLMPLQKHCLINCCFWPH